MKNCNRSVWLMGALILFVSSGLGVALVVAQQGPSQESSGPRQGTGGTILAPKPSRTPQPFEPLETPEKLNLDETFALSVTTELVNFDIVVTDKNGNFIPSLEQPNFRLFEDGVEQQITNFARSEGAMTVCLLIEFRSTRLWTLLVEALRNSYMFVNYLQPQDWAAVVVYDMNPQILTDFTQNRQEVVHALDRLRFPGFREANLYDSLNFVMENMSDIKGKKAIILITTGIDTFSKLNYSQFLKIVRGSDTIIYPISIGGWLRARGYENIDNFQADNALKTFAKYTGGMAFFPRFQAQIPGIYEQISQHLRNQYNLGFVSTNSQRDGKFRKVRINVVDPEGNPLILRNRKGKKVKLRVVARDGYYGPKSSG